MSTESAVSLVVLMPLSPLSWHLTDRSAKTLIDYLMYVDPLYSSERVNWEFCRPLAVVGEKDLHDLVDDSADSVSSAEKGSQIGSGITKNGLNSRKMMYQSQSTS